MRVSSRHVRGPTRVAYHSVRSRRTYGAHYKTHYIDTRSTRATHLVSDYLTNASKMLWSCGSKLVSPLNRVKLKWCSDKESVNTAVNNIISLTVNITPFNIAV